MMDNWKRIFRIRPRSESQAHELGPGQETAEPDPACGLAGRGLRGLADFLFARPRWVFYPQLVLLLVCVVYAVTTLQFSTDRSDLVSAHQRYRRDFLDLKKEFRLPEVLVVAVESESQDKNRRFVERLAARLRYETNLITRVYFKGDLKLMGPKALLFLPEAILADLRQVLRTNRALIATFAQAATLDAQFELVNRQFDRLRTAPVEEWRENSLVGAVPTLQRLVDKAAESALATAAVSMPGTEVLFGADRGKDRYGRYLASASGEIYVLTAEATTPERESDAIQKLRELVEQTKGEVPGINVGITGESVLRHDEMEQAQRDIQLATVISLVLTALILIGGFRELRRPLLATLCLLVGIGYTLAFATLSVGRLNLLSITMVPILIGLAIDFGVHLVSRYEEELRTGSTPPTAMRTALGFTGVGILTSALTTAGAFLTMILADFQGIQQMGWIAGMGLLICLVPMLTLLPVMLVRTEPDLPDHLDATLGRSQRSPLILSLDCRSRDPRTARSRPTRRAWIEQAFLKWPRTVLVCGGAFTVFTLVQLPKVHFDFNLQNLQTRDLPAVEMEMKLNRTGSQSVLSCAVIANSLAEAATLEQQILRLPSVASVTSLVQYLTEDQERKLALVRGIKSDLEQIPLPEQDMQPVDLQRLNQTLLVLQSNLRGAAAGLRAQGGGTALEIQLRLLRNSVSQLQSLVAQGNMGTAARLTAFQQRLFRDLRETVAVIGQQNDRERLRWEEVPSFLRERFMSSSGRFMLEVHPRANIWQRDKQEEFVRELRTVDPNVTGSPVQFYESTLRLKEGFQKAAAYALAIVAVLVLLHFRRVDAMLLALLPVLLGYGWMLGLMGWIGIPFNPVNIASLALVVGIGVTNGVHVLNRFIEEDSPVILTRSTGKAVVLSGLTTIAGFGSLLVAKHQGIASLGAVMSIGTATCMVAALVFLPAALNLMGRMGWSLVGRRTPPPA